MIERLQVWLPVWHWHMGIGQAAHTLIPPSVYDTIWYWYKNMADIRSAIHNIGHELAAGSRL